MFLSKKNEKEDLFQIITTSSSNNHHPLQKLGSFYVRDIKDKRLSLWEKGTNNGDDEGFSIAAHGTLSGNWVLMESISHLYETFLGQFQTLCCSFHPLQTALQWLSRKDNLRWKSLGTWKMKWRRERATRFWIVCREGRTQKLFNKRMRKGSEDVFPFPWNFQFFSNVVF